MTATTTSSAKTLCFSGLALAMGHLGPFENAVGYLVAFVMCVANLGLFTALFYPSRIRALARVTSDLGCRQSLRKRSHAVFTDHDSSNVDLARKAQTSFRVEVPWTRWESGWARQVADQLDVLAGRDTEVGRYEEKVKVQKEELGSSYARLFLGICEARANNGG